MDLLGSVNDGDVLMGKDRWEDILEQRALLLEITRRLDARDLHALRQASSTLLRAVNSVALRSLRWPRGRPNAELPVGLLRHRDAASAVTALDVSGRPSLADIGDYVAASAGSCAASPPERHLAGLRRLHLAQCRGSAEDIARLVGCCAPALREVNMTCAWSVNNEVLGELATAQCLRTLNLANCACVTDEGLSVLGRLQALESLRLSSCTGVSDAGLASLASSAPPRLASLDLSHCGRITDAGVASLSRLRSLEDLDLSYCSGVGDEGMCALASGRSAARFQRLVLRKCARVGEKGVRELAASMPRLRQLNLAFCSNMTDDGVLDLIEGCLDLRMLDLSWISSITAACLLKIGGGLSRLERLNLSQCSGVSDAVLHTLRNATQLQHLDLSNCDRITNDGLTHLGSLHKLSYLDLYGCTAVTGAALGQLAGLPKLQSLHVAFYDSEVLTQTNALRSLQMRSAYF